MCVSYVCMCMCLCVWVGGWVGAHTHTHTHTLGNAHAGPHPELRKKQSKRLFHPLYSALVSVFFPPFCFFYTLVKKASSHVCLHMFICMHSVCVCVCVCMYILCARVCACACM